MVVIPQYTDEVQVVLSAVGSLPGEPIRDRYLFLSKDNTKAFIGRTSKRDVNLEAAENNGWIDSAVMSRDHAVLEFDPVEKTVTVVDIGSLHGTYLNDQRVAKHHAKQLHAGDTLRFGVSIQKGAEVFTPCKMNVTINFGSMSPVNHPMVFRVPESTDGEEEESEESDAEDPVVNNSIEIIRNSGLNSSVGSHTRSRARSLSGAVELEDEDVDDNSSVDKDEAEEHHTALPMSLDDEILFGNGEEPTSATEQPAHVDLSDLDDSDSDDPFSADSVLSNSSDWFNSSDDDLANTTKITEPETPTKTGSNEDELPKHFALHHGVKSLDGAQRDYLADEGATVSAETENRQFLNLLYETEAPAAADDCDMLPPIDPPHTGEPNTTQLPSITEATSTPFRSRTSNVDAEEAAAILGAKSGKVEYFAAREHNRRALGDSIAFQEDDGGLAVTKVWNGGAESSDSADGFACGLPDNCTIFTGDSANEALLASGTQFLHTPLKEKETELLQVEPSLFVEDDDPFDDTSAYTFEISTKGSKTTVHQTPRVIEDTKLQEEKPTNVPERKSAKRKAAEISVLSAEEASYETTCAEGLTEGLSTTADIVQHTCQLPPPKPDLQSARPAKRLRQVAEVFGIAALGGVAVMTALIATAPAL